MYQSVPELRVRHLWTGSAAPPDAYGFAYDQAGERVLRYRVEGGAVQEARFFIRDEGGNVLSEFLWSPTGLWTRMSDTAYLGRRPLVRMETTPGADRQYTTLVTDHLDSVRAEIFDATYTDPSYNTMDYWPFGELVSHPATLKSKHLFTAHEREFIGSASGVNTLEGVDYMHARYYNPSLGRFLSVDPVAGSVGSSQSWNRYSYVLNSPANFVDPTGETVKLDISDTDAQNDLLAQWELQSGLDLKLVNGEVQVAGVKTDDKGNPLGSAEARSILLDRIGSSDVHTIHGVNNDPGVTLGEAALYANRSEISVDFGDIGSLNYGRTPEATFNAGMVALHELVHTMGKEDPPAGSPGRGAVVDTVNRVRSQLGLPLRSKYHPDRAGLSFRFRFTSGDVVFTPVFSSTIVVTGR